ncbi:MAG: hypothetical protein ACJA2W_002847, partial [Planctomycetota bacterium]
MRSPTSHYVQCGPPARPPWRPGVTPLARIRVVLQDKYSLVQPPTRRDKMPGSDALSIHASSPRATMAL